MTSPTYGVDNLLEALIKAERYRNAAPELRDWHQKRSRALSTALGYDADEPTADVSLTGADSMLSRAIAAAAGYQSHPFSGFMECPKELYEVMKPHSSAIAGLSKDMSRAWAALARALLLRLHPHLAAATTTSTTLKSLGFDDGYEPDEFDFF